MAGDGTLTRADLAESLHKNVGLSKAESSKLVESILDHMSNALAKGENVKISGFGSFLLRDKGARVGRNPKTGVEVPIAPRRVLTFRASQMMRANVAQELSAELGVPQHILRYWETKFSKLRPLTRAGNRRYYRPDDVVLVRRIHQLLNVEGYTVKGVQKVLTGKTATPSESAEPVVASSAPQPHRQAIFPILF
eukprot:gene27266-36005_t